MFKAVGKKVIDPTLPPDKEYNIPISLQIESPTINFTSNDNSITGTAENFSILLNQPPGNQIWNFPPNYQAYVGVSSLAYTNSVYNIDYALSNFFFGYRTAIGNPTKFVVFPQGLFQITDLNTYLQNYMSINGDLPDEGTNITITYDQNQIKAYFEFSNGFVLDFESSYTETDPTSPIYGQTFEPTLYEWVGCEPAIYYTSGVVENYLNMVPVTNLYVQTDLLALGNYSMINGKQSQVIRNSYISADPGYEQNDPIYVVKYYPVSGNNISKFSVWITDQNNNPISLNGQGINMELTFLYKTIGE